MIVFGVCAGGGNRFDSIAGPALSKHAPDVQVIVLRDQLSISSAYNKIIDTAIRLADLEAVVLLHDDVEIVDPEWRSKLLGAFANEGTAVVGVIGASGKGGMAWFTRAQKRGAVREPGRDYDYGDRSATVDVIDGLFIALSPNAARTLRFDERSYPPFHGYDADICSQALASGQVVALAPIDLVHHTRGAFGTTRSYADWIRASLAWRIAWEPSSSAKRMLLRLRKFMVPLEIRIRPSTRARRRDLVARRAAATPATASGATPLAGNS